MKKNLRVTFRVTYGDGAIENIVIYAQTINVAFGYAVRAARDNCEPNGSSAWTGRVCDIARIEFFEAV